MVKQMSYCEFVSCVFAVKFVEEKNGITSVTDL